LNKRKYLRILSFIVFFGLCLVLVACAPKTDTTDPAGNGNTEGNGSATTDFNWSVESNCSTCHERSVTSLTRLSCEAAQANAPNDTCMICHDDTTGVKAAHAAVKLSDTAGDGTRLKKSEISESVCLACHDLEELKSTTADNTELTDNSGIVVNPHEVSTTLNINGNHSSAICSSCHKMHSTEAIGNTAERFCLDCHHTGDYECGTCH